MPPPDPAIRIDAAHGPPPLRMSPVHESHQWDPLARLADESRVCARCGASSASARGVNPCEPDAAPQVPHASHEWSIGPAFMRRCLQCGAHVHLDRAANETCVPVPVSTPRLGHVRLADRTPSHRTEAEVLAARKGCGVCCERYGDRMACHCLETAQELDRLRGTKPASRETPESHEVWGQPLPTPPARISAHAVGSSVVVQISHAADIVLTRAVAYGLRLQLDRAIDEAGGLQ